jgi:hypothetical protein
MLQFLTDVEISRLLSQVNHRDFCNSFSNRNPLAVC